MSKLKEELEFWRCERPSEYKMDDFIREVNKLESTLKEALNLCSEILDDGYFEGSRGLDFIKTLKLLEDQA